MLNTKLLAKRPDGAADRRIFRMRVLEAELPRLTKDVVLVGCLCRVSDEKEIDTEREKSPTYSIKSAVAGKLKIDWDCSFGQNYNLNHKTGQTCTVGRFSNENNLSNRTRQSST